MFKRITEDNYRVLEGRVRSVDGAETFGLLIGGKTIARIHFDTEDGPITLSHVFTTDEISQHLTPGADVKIYMFLSNRITAIYAIVTDDGGKIEDVRSVCQMGRLASRNQLRYPVLLLAVATPIAFVALSRPTSVLALIIFAFWFYSLASTINVFRNGQWGEAMMGKTLDGKGFKHPITLS